MWQADPPAHMPPQLAMGEGVIATLSDLGGCPLAHTRCPRAVSRLATRATLAPSHRNRLHHLLHHFKGCRSLSLQPHQSIWHWLSPGHWLFPVSLRCARQLVAAYGRLWGSRVPWNITGLAPWGMHACDANA